MNVKKAVKSVLVSSVASLVMAGALAEQPIDEKEPNGQFEDIGCNVATLDGQTIHWTSAFLTTNYELARCCKSPSYGVAPIRSAR